MSVKANRKLKAPNKVFSLKVIACSHGVRDQRYLRKRAPKSYTPVADP